ncbi:MAG: hypothetical protein ACF8CQ_24205 [Rhodopirellula sp. JB044]|uniref:hypothetical protein n=1 Tax=Rhodopirellula sp. JB044 TaxID=3342844 RepID=UPI00370B5A19
MKPIYCRLLLGLAVLGCIGVGICSSLLHMSHLASFGISSEIRDETVSIERRLEIAQGIDNANTIQMTLANVSWWLALVTGLLVAAVALWGFRRLPTD